MHAIFWTSSVTKMSKSTSIIAGPKSESLITTYLQNPTKMASTDTVPPAYNNDVDAPPAYTRDEKIAIQSGAAVELQKPEVKAKLQLDRVVENKLGEIDSKKLGEAYQPKWVAFRKVNHHCFCQSDLTDIDCRFQRYLELLSESQRTATTIATEAESMSSYVLYHILAWRLHLFDTRIRHLHPALRHW